VQKPIHANPSVDELNEFRRVQIHMVDEPPTLHDLVNDAQEPNFECLHCGRKTFSDRAELIEHITFHPKVESPQEPSQIDISRPKSSINPKYPPPDRFESFLAQSPLQIREQKILAQLKRQATQQPRRTEQGTQSEPSASGPSNTIDATGAIYAFEIQNEELQLAAREEQGPVVHRLTANQSHSFAESVSKRRDQARLTLVNASSTTRGSPRRAQRTSIYHYQAPTPELNGRNSRSFNDSVSNRRDEATWTFVNAGPTTNGRLQEAKRTPLCYSVPTRELIGSNSRSFNESVSDGKDQTPLVIVNANSRTNGRVQEAKRTPLYYPAPTRELIGSNSRSFNESVSDGKDHTPLVIVNANSRTNGRPQRGQQYPGHYYGPPARQRESKARRSRRYRMEEHFSSVV